MAIDLRNFTEVNFAILFKVMNAKELCYVCIKYVLRIMFLCVNTHTYIYVCVDSVCLSRRMKVDSGRGGFV